MDSLEIRKGIEELDPMEAFKRNPWEYTLSRISKTLHTPEMLEEIFANTDQDSNGLILLRIISKRLISRPVCEKAILLRNGRNIYFTPNEYIDMDLCEKMMDHHLSLRLIPCKSKELCEKAVQQNWENLEYVPPQYKVKEICKCALEQNIAAIRFFPERFITPELAMEAIRKSDAIVNDLKGPGGWPISFIPAKLRTEEMIDLSLSLFPESVASIPQRYMTKGRTLAVVRRNGLLLHSIPDQFRSKESIIKAALDQNPLAFRYVPDEKITREMCDNAFKYMWNEGQMNFYAFPELYRDEYIKKYENRQPVLHVHPMRLVAHEEDEEDTGIIEVEDNASLTAYNVTENNNASTQRIYYVSDLHLEHQLDINNKTLHDISTIIEDKIEELLVGVPDRNSTLLIAGDTADGEQLTALFFKKLRSYWKGQIVAVVGNHELWDSYCETNRTVDTIISTLKDVCESNHLLVLENELLVFYKGREWTKFTEEDIQNARPDELKSICDKSLLIILGGNGFSGCNPRFNADAGLYRDKLSRTEEIARSERFRNIHDKLKECVGDNRIIVLTHTAPEDWTTGKLNSHWIYVFGHNHHNRYAFNDNEPCILGDNQIGYRPRIWRLKCFELENMMRYDPLSHLPDGIHEISAHTYKDFNRCMGIDIDDFKRQGHIYAIKRCGVYMFIYESRKVSILAGGGLRTGYHDKQYYYDNMPQYVSQIRKLFTPYYNALSHISESVKKIGGSGRIHGSIVDIDFYNHLYLDPYNGEVKPYFAYDMVNKIFYKDIYHLVQQSPHMIDRNKYLLKLGENEKGKKKLFLTDSKKVLASVPRIVFDTEMYEPSRNMRSVQYVLEQNVIRFWRDAILDYAEYEALTGINSNS